MSESGPESRTGQTLTPARDVSAGDLPASCPLSCSHPFVMGILGGACVALGASLLVAIQTGAPGGYGIAAVLAGLGLAAGLFLASIGRCAVFAGTPAPFLAWFRAEMTTERLASCLLSTLLGNAIGALVVVWLVFLAGQYALADAQVGQTALAIASQKCALPFVSMLIRGLFGGALVALALWLAAGAQTLVDRAIAVSIPAVLLVSCGFTHCVSDLYLVPMGLAIQTWEAVPAEGSAITLAAFVLRVFIPGAIGGLIGAGFAVGALQWAKHARTAAPCADTPRPRRRVPRSDTTRAPGPHGTRRRVRPRLDDDETSGPPGT